MGDYSSIQQVIRDELRRLKHDESDLAVTMKQKDDKK